MITKSIIPFLLLFVAVIVFGKYMMWKRATVRALESESQLQQTRLGPMEYKIYGEGEDVVVFLHGSPGGYDQYRPDGNVLSEGRRVLAISRPGYLRTPLSTGQTPSQQADAVAALLDELDIGSVIIAGGSGGAPASLAFAALHPHRTRALIVYAGISHSFTKSESGTGPRLFELASKTDFGGWLLLRPLASKPEKLLAALVPDSANRERILTNQLEKNLARAVESTLPYSHRKAGVDNDWRQYEVLDLPLERITAPTMIYHGTEDTNVPLVQSQYLHERVAGSALILLEGGDHFAQYSHKSEITAQTRAFLQDLFLRLLGLRRRTAAGVGGTLGKSRGGCHQ